MNFNTTNFDDVPIYNDESVAVGLRELSRVTQENAFAEKVCSAYNHLFYSKACLYAPCKDLCTMSDDLLDKVISFYATQLELVCPGPSLNVETGKLERNIVFLPRPSLYKAIRTIALKYQD